MKSNRVVWNRLIAVEGIDGAGTTTLTGRLQKALAAKDVACAAGFEPTDGPIGELIRRGISSAVPLSRKTLAMLFAADRREHLYGPGGIQECLEAGSFYITDRYFFSSLAYQSMDAPWEWVDSLNEGYPLPGLLIYLSLPASDAMQRIAGRSTRDIYETESQQQQVARLYEHSFAAYDCPEMEILRLDSRQPPSLLAEQALEAVLRRHPETAS